MLAVGWSKSRGSARRFDSAESWLLQLQTIFRWLIFGWVIFDWLIFGWLYVYVCVVS